MAARVSFTCLGLMGRRRTSSAYSGKTTTEFVAGNVVYIVKYSPISNVIYDILRSFRS